VQVGNANANVSRNIFQLNIDGAAVADATGMRIFGKQNLFTVDIIQVAPGRGIVFEATAEANRVTAMNLAGGLTNNATKPTSKVIVADPIGLAVDTPEIPVSGEPITNRSCLSIDALILDAGDVSEWTLTTADGVSQTIPGPLQTGQSIALEPGDALIFHYTGIPSWRWMGR